MAKIRTDWILFLTIVAMVGFGLVIMYSASSAVAELRYNVAPYYFVVRQILFALGSFAALMYLKRIDYRRWNTPTWAFSVLGIVLASLLLVFVVDSSRHRWFRIPGVGSLQPSEFAKPAIILFLAYFLSRRAKMINDGRTLGQISLAVIMLGAPPGILDLLEPLPDGARIRTTLPRATGADVVLAFVTERSALDGLVTQAGPVVFPAGGLWICWPKRTSGVTTDITEDVLRDVILPTGLVDNKVCAHRRHVVGTPFRVAKRTPILTDPRPHAVRKATDRRRVGIASRTGGP